MSKQKFTVAFTNGFSHTVTWPTGRGRDLLDIVDDALAVFKAIYKVDGQIEATRSEEVR